VLNKTDIYDRNLFKNKFKEIYNQNQYNFTLNNDLLSNIINNWKRNSIKFKKYSIYSNKYDYNNLILREFSSFISTNKKIK